MISEWRNHLVTFAESASANATFTTMPKTLHAAPAPDSDDDPRDPPVKVIDRAARLLRALAVHPHEGAPFTELMEQTGFGKSTTHRLLAALVDTGFVFQDFVSKRYRLGSAFALLSRNAMTQLRAAACQVSLAQLAQSTEDTVFAQVAEGNAAVCIGRATGSFPIRTLTLDEGDRRPLGVGAGSLALLAAMPDEAIDKIIQRNQRWLRDFPTYTREVLLSLVEETRLNGYAVNTGRIVPGMHAVGVPVMGAEGRVVASLSVAAITDRMAPARADKIARMLQNEAFVLTARLASDAAE